MIHHNLFGASRPASAAARNHPSPGAGLSPLPGFPFTAAASRGHIAVATRIARRTGHAYGFLQKVLGVAPKLRLLVLDATDWSHYADAPAYGITHFTTDGHLVVGAEPAAAWNDVSRYFALGLPAADLRALVAALGRDPMFAAGPDLASVADTLVAHDLAHLMTAQAGASFGRRCLSEAFANYALVAVLGETDPDGLHRLSALADAALLLADATPTLREFDAGCGTLDPVSSVLAHLALTRSVFLAYAAARAQPLARWFAIACAAGRRKSPPDADHELGRLLTREVHPAIGHLALHCAAEHASALRAA